jgi:TRAP-type C4-dicarboxylate transport system permease small subunit
VTDSTHESEAEDAHASLRTRSKVETALYLASAVLMLLLAVLVFYSVIMRYVFSRPPIWAENVPLTLFIWMTFIGAAVATKRGLNLKVTYFVDKLPVRARSAIEVVMHALVLALLVTLFVYNIPIIELQWPGRMLSTGWSNAVNFVPLSVGCLLMIWYQIRLLRRALRRYADARDEAAVPRRA